MSRKTRDEFKEQVIPSVSVVGRGRVAGEGTGGNAKK